MYRKLKMVVNLGFFKEGNEVFFNNKKKQLFIIN